jgi:hypothetical protein
LLDPNSCAIERRVETGVTAAKPKSARRSECDNGMNKDVSVIVFSLFCAVTLWAGSAQAGAALKALQPQPRQCVIPPSPAVEASSLEAFFRYWAIFQHKNKHVPQ